MQCPSCSKRFDAPIPPPVVPTQPPLDPSTPWKYAADRCAPKRPTKAVVIGWVIVAIVGLIFWPVTLIAGAAYLGYRFSRQNKGLIAALAGGGVLGVLLVGFMLVDLAANGTARPAHFDHRSPDVNPVTGRAEHVLTPMPMSRPAVAAKGSIPRKADGAPDWSKIPDAKPAPLEPLGAKVSGADVQQVADKQEADRQAALQTTAPTGVYGGGYDRHSRRHDARRNHHAH